jgi:predicted DCC family thiol-disulfide oxidoreductase YuxK
MTPAEPGEYPDPVLLFDGECGLCQRVVRLLLRLDRSGRLRYASLQSPSAQAFLAARRLPTKDFESLIFVTDWEKRADAPYLERTSGAVAALRVCGGLGRVFATLISLVPHGGRDAIYRWVGRTRYRWFGPWKPRPLANPEWERRFVG